MRAPRVWLAAALALTAGLLLGCAGGGGAPIPPRETGTSGAAEFDVTRIEAARYRIRASAPNASAASVERLALKRAAEIARAEGAARFQLGWSETARGARGADVGVGVGVFGGSSSGLGGGISVGIPLDRPRTVSRIEVLLLRQEPGGPALPKAGDGVASEDAVAEVYAVDALLGPPSPPNASGF